MPLPLPRRAPVCLGIVLTATSVACRSGSEPAPPDPGVVAVAPAIAPVHRSGLELAWWITRDTDATLGPTLLAIGDTDQRFDPDVLDSLRAHGLRPVRMRESALLELATAAMPVVGIDQVWVGIAPDWTAARLPAPADASTPRAIAGLVRRVPAGALRLLWRSYLAAEGLDPVLRIDLLGQAISPDHARERFDATRSVLPRAIDAGPVIEAISATLVLRPGEVIVLVGDAPDADWSLPPAAPGVYDPDAPPPGVAVPPPPPPPVLFDADDPPPAHAEPATVITPPLPPRERTTPRTFGEMLLTASMPGDPSRSGRLILAIIPRIPDRMEVIPRPRAPG